MVKLFKALFKHIFLYTLDISQRPSCGVVLKNEHFLHWKFGYFQSLLCEGHFNLNIIVQTSMHSFRFQRKKQILMRNLVSGKEKEIPNPPIEFEHCCITDGTLCVQAKGIHEYLYIDLKNPKEWHQLIFSIKRQIKTKDLKGEVFAFGKKLIVLLERWIQIIDKTCQKSWFISYPKYLSGLNLNFVLIAKVENKCYFYDKNANRFHSYDFDQCYWSAHRRLPRTQNQYSSYHFVNSTCKVYHNRYIFINTRQRNDSFYYWYYLIFDTKKEHWIKSRNIDRQPKNNSFLENEIWIDDTCAFYNCLCNTSPGKVCKCNTKLFDVSHFLPNWRIIGHLIKLRKLVEKKRAVISDWDSEFNKTIAFIFDILDDDIFLYIIKFLIESKSEKGKN